MILRFILLLFDHSLFLSLSEKMLPSLLVYCLISYYVMSILDFFAFGYFFSFSSYGSSSVFLCAFRSFIKLNDILLLIEARKN